MADREAAIARIEESRATHVLWADYWKAIGGCSCEGCEKTAGIAGDADHHRECIAGYDNVLEVLRG